VLVVRTDGPYKTLKDFVDAAKANPGKINYSSSGVVRHAARRDGDLRQRRRDQAVPRALPGGGPAVTALLGGHVEALGLGARRRRSGRSAAARCARSPAGAQRLALLPEIPTFKELGYDAEFLHLDRRLHAGNHAAQ